MKRVFTLTIEPEFFLLISKGQGDINVDNEMVTDKYGIPYIPGTTIKGLLRESCIEVLEMQNELDINVNKFFGQAGLFVSNSCIRISDGLIPQYPEILETLRVSHQEPHYKPKLIKDYFLTTLHQTAINNEGIALKGSLRSMKVLDHLRNSKFECEIILDEKMLIRNGIPSKRAMAILENTVANLNYAGLSRNRGLGKIKCHITEKIEKVKEKRFDHNIDSENTSLLVVLNLKESAIISQQTGDQNTVYCSDSINGGKILGILAHSYIEKYGSDSDFKDLFLNNIISFGSLSKNGSIPIPMNLQNDKYSTNQVFDIFEEGFDFKGKSTKVINKYLSGNGVVEIEKSSSFHTSRSNRLAGSSTKKEGNIYYYESLDRNQTFLGTIDGESSKLNLLLSKLGSSINGYVGLSKSVRYGKVHIQLEPFSIPEKVLQDEKVENNQHYLVFITAGILLNEQGECDPSTSCLERSLGPEVKIEKSYFRTTYVQSYNSIWGSKTQRQLAIKEGSTYLISGYDATKIISSIGEQCYKGYGRVRVFTKSDMNVLKSKLVSSLNTDIHPEQPDPANSMVPNILTDIKNDYEVNQRKMEIAEIAFSDYQPNPLLKRMILKNNSISRITTALKKQKNMDNWKVVFEEISKARIKAKLGSTLYAKILSLEFMSEPKSDLQVFESKVEYWLNIFRLLRLRNRQAND